MDLKPDCEHYFLGLSGLGHSRRTSHPTHGRFTHNAHTGTEMSFLLLPFNYFPEDPSVGISDNIRLQYDSPDSPLKIMAQSKTNDLTCKPPKTYSIEDLTKDPDVFIERPKL